MNMINHIIENIGDEVKLFNVYTNRLYSLVILLNFTLYPLTY